MDLRDPSASKKGIHLLKAFCQNEPGTQVFIELFLQDFSTHTFVFEDAS